MSSFFKLPGSSPFKGHNPIKGLGNTLRNISDFVSSASDTSGIKSLRLALIEGDEEKALQLYLTVVKGRSLSEDLAVSAPFPIKRHEDQSPLHLAAISSLKDIITKFLEQGGNPSLVNAHGQTCLHCICCKQDKSLLRAELLSCLMSWKGVEVDGTCDEVSLNHVDEDGNTALHYAANNNLVACVIRLIANGAIISIGFFILFILLLYIQLVVAREGAG